MRAWRTRKKDRPRKKDTAVIRDKPSEMATGTSVASEVQRTPPVAPGRLPGIGHLAVLLRNPLAFMRSLPPVADVVTIHLGLRPMYVVNSTDLVRSMLVSEAGNCTRGFIFEKAGKVFGHGMIVAEGELHKRQRRLLQPAFHQQQIERYTTVMIDAVAAKARSWEAGQAFAVNSEMHDLGLEILCRALFRTDLAASAAKEVKQAFPGIVKGITAQALYPMQWLEKLPIPVNRRYQAAVPQLRKVIEEIITSYRDTDIVAGDVLAMLMAARDQETGHGMSDEQLRDEVVTLLVAGTETVSTTLAWLFHELAENPDVEQRLVNELDIELGDAPLRFEDLARLTYTSAVVNEVLRLHTPNWILTRRAEQSLNLGGFQIPAGGELAFSLTTLHRDPALYDNPMRFDPLRWLDGRTANLPRGAFIPFAIGKHKCIGDIFAINEMLVAVATITRQWRLVRKPGTRVRELPWTTVQPSGLTMYPAARRAVP